MHICTYGRLAASGQLDMHSGYLGLYWQLDVQLYSIFILNEVNASVGCKAEVKSMAVTQLVCLSLLTLIAMYTPAYANVDGYFR